MKTDKEFIGTLIPPNESSLYEVLKDVVISRGGFIGPCFDIEAAGSFADPSIERIATKVAKQYRTRYTMELLAYYELQPVLPRLIWLPRVQEYVKQNLQGSLFRRIWIFDVGTEAVIWKS